MAGSLTHVMQWSNHGGWSHISIEEARKYYDGQTVSAKEAVLMCALCRNNVIMTKTTRFKDSYFKHNKGDEDKDCPDRSNSTYIYGEFEGMYQDKRQLPFKLKYNNYRVSLYLGLLPLPDEIIERNIRNYAILYDQNGHEIRQISFENLENRTTYIKMNLWDQKRIQVGLLHRDDDIWQIWSNNNKGVIGGALFDKVTGRRIARNGQVLVGSTYYYLGKNSLTSKSSAVSVKAIPIVASYGYRLWEVKANRYCAESARFFFKLWANLTTKLQKVIPLWPEYEESDDRFYIKEKQVFLHNSGKHQLVLQNQQIVSDEFVTRRFEHKERGRMLIFGENNYITDFAYFWQDELKKVPGDPDIDVEICDRKSNKVYKDGNYENLPNNSLVIKGNDKSVVFDVEIYSKQGILLNKHTCNAWRYQPKSNQEIRVYYGFRLLRKVSFFKQVLVEDNELLHLLKNARGKMVAIPHRYWSKLVKLNKYPQSYAWLQEHRKQFVPQKVLKILRRQFENE